MLPRRTHHITPATHALHRHHRYFMNPVMAACQLVNVSRVGEEPDLWNADEDCRLLLPKAVVLLGAGQSS